MSRRPAVQGGQIEHWSQLRCAAVPSMHGSAARSQLHGCRTANATSRQLQGDGQALGWRCYFMLQGRTCAPHPDHIPLAACKSRRPSNAQRLQLATIKLTATHPASEGVRCRTTAKLYMLFAEGTSESCWRHIGARHQCQPRQREHRGHGGVEMQH